MGIVAADDNGDDCTVSSSNEDTTIKAKVEALLLYLFADVMVDRFQNRVAGSAAIEVIILHKAIVPWTSTNSKKSVVSEIENQTDNKDVLSLCDRNS